MEPTTDDFFSSVLDAAPDAMLVVDEQGSITFANRQASELFGLARDELVGAPIEDLLPPEFRQGHRAHRLRYRANPTIRPMGVDMLLRAQRADGSVFPVEVSLSPLRGAGGDRVVAAVRDVSARVAAEDDMRRILLTLDATEDAVFILDADSMRFSYVNDGASRQVGYRRDELIGMTPMHINPELSESELRAIVDEVQSAQQAAVSVRTTHRRRDGTDIPVEMSWQSSPKSSDGSTVPIIGVARDISSRLRAESQMRRSEAVLREAEQAMAIADDRERIARDLHDTVIQRLFASGLVLQAIIGRVDPEVSTKLETVVDDLDQTIREIRTAIFALQAPGPGDAGLRTQILDLVREAAGSLGFEPRLQFEGAIETMDESISEQMLPTLREALTNVAKHAAATSVKVIVEVGDGRVEMTVQDDGIGLPEETGGGHGLRNMEARARQLDGVLDARRLEPSGTRLVWSVPTAGSWADSDGEPVVS